MMGEDSINREIERVVMGLVGLFMAGLMALRLWRWYAGFGVYKTLWGAIAGGPLNYGRICWDYGFWQLFPDGQLAAVSVLIVVVALLAGVILNWRPLYFLAGSVVAAGCLVNACMMLKLMAAY